MHLTSLEVLHLSLRSNFSMTLPALNTFPSEFLQHFSEMLRFQKFTCFFWIVSKLLHVYLIYFIIVIYIFNQIKTFYLKHWQHDFSSDPGSNLFSQMSWQPSSKNTFKITGGLSGSKQFKPIFSKILWKKKLEIRAM